MTYPYVRHRDADARLTTRLIVPAITSVPCLVWMQGGDSLISLARRNLADRTLMDVTGSPTINAGYARTTGVSHLFRSQVMETDSFTFFVFGRRSDTSADSAHTGAYGGSFVGATDPGWMMYWQSSTIIRGQASQGTNTAVTTTLSVASGADTFKRYRLECERSGGAGTITIFNDTDETEDATPGTFSAAPDLGTLPSYFGASRSAAFLGHTEWNHLSYFSGIVTADEVDAHWAQVLAIAADMGVTENT